MGVLTVTLTLCRAPAWGGGAAAVPAEMRAVAAGPVSGCAGCGGVGLCAATAAGADTGAPQFGQKRSLARSSCWQCWQFIVFPGHPTFAAGIGLTAHSHSIPLAGGSRWIRPGRMGGAAPMGDNGCCRRRAGDAAKRKGCDAPSRREFMTAASLHGKETLVADLGNGLVLRRATPADAAELAAFNGEIHGGASGPDVHVAALTRDMLTRSHPTFRPELFTIVEDASSGQIVSSLNLIPQTWSYGGIPVGVGRIELVGTHPDYRRRGLVRRQFEVVHRWSAEMGHLV